MQSLLHHIFSLQCHIVEGDLVRAILLTLDGAHLIFFISFLVLSFPFMEAVMPLMALFRMWNASPANILLLIVIISDLLRHVIDIVLSP
jgi:hypothetical protein